MPTPEEPKTTFTVADFNNLNTSSCADDPCGKPVIVNDDPCPDCCGGGGEVGPQGPPGPQGPAGDAGCPKLFAGPLIDQNEMAFEHIKGLKGYIVSLDFGGGDSSYKQASFDAVVRTLGPGEQGYIDTSNEPGNNAPILENPNTSGLSGYIYPIALKTTGSNGYNYYQNEVKFEDFLRARARYFTNGADADYFFNNRAGIASLLSSGTTGDSEASSETGAPYTFICSDSSMKDSANGPYRLGDFFNLVDGVVKGNTLYTDLQPPNPPSVSNLGDKILTPEGGLGISYDCESCIQPLGDDYKLTDTTQAEGCTYFVDTENGVLYEKDTNEGSPNFGRFRVNGIPLRRTPELPEGGFEKEDLTGIIVGHQVSSNNDPPTRWTYTVEDISFNTTTLRFEASGNQKTAYNGAENNDDIDGIGLGQFDAFPDPTAFTMLPIRNGTVVNLHRVKGKYIFNLVNAYSGCGGA